MPTTNTPAERAKTALASRVAEEVAARIPGCTAIARRSRIWFLDEDGCRRASAVTQARMPWHRGPTPADQPSYLLLRTPMSHLSHQARFSVRRFWRDGPMVPCWRVIADIVRLEMVADGARLPPREPLPE